MSAEIELRNAAWSKTPVRKVNVELPDGDTRKASVRFHEQVDDVLTVCVSVSNTSQLIAALPCVHICGAEATGKTSMAGYISAHYGLTTLPETARIELDVRGTSFGQLRANVDATNEYQIGVFDRQIALEHSAAPPYVSDRTCLDNLAYASENATVYKQLATRLRAAEGKEHTVLERLRQSVVFLVRPQESVQGKDGIRAGADYVAKQRIDAKIELLLQDFDVRFIPIDVEGGAARARIVDEVLQPRGFKWKSR